MTHYLSRLRKQICENWNSPALCDYDGTSITFGELALEIERYHIYFRKAGITKGDKIAICAKNQARWGVAFFAINTYGAVAVPILDNFHPDGIASIINHSGSIMLFTDKDIWQRLVKNSIGNVSNVIDIASCESLMCSDGLIRLDSTVVPENFGPDRIVYPTDNDKDLAVINYTSGSTGDPKGVMLRYECISANVEYGQKRIPSHSGDHMLSILPMAHMFGMVFELIYPICGGATIWFLGKAPSPTLLIKAMRQVKPYLVIAVPMIFEKIYKGKIKPMAEKPAIRAALSIPLIKTLFYNKIRKSIDNSFGGKVRMYIMGGAAVNPEVEDFLHKIKFHYTVGYGMTEAAPLLTYEDWDKFAVHSCGKAMDFIELRIKSDDERHIPGEIQARGISLFSGYYNNPELTAQAFTKDGWFNTGDLGTIDNDGNLHINGRSKSMLLTSNGQNIYPEEIECLFNSLPQVYESLVIGRDGHLVALIYPSEGTLTDDNSAGEIISQINAKLPKYSQIAKIEFQRDPFKKTPKLSIKRFLYK